MSPAAPIRPVPLPVPATSFIGREAELAQIAELLSDPYCRLLTIVGQGGIGKTRLALQTAVGHQPVFANGVAWVSLNTVQTEDQCAAAVAASLNYHLRGTASAETELFPLLVNKELLLVLDNFEHLQEAGGFLTRLLEQTAAVKLLVTSRQALELPQEWRFELGTLPLPDEESAGTLAANSSVRLFIQSGRRVAAAFDPTEADYRAIARICCLVDGMPLGIELSASWLRLLSCAEIAQEIDRSFDFLTVTLGHLPPRHRSLRAVFDYSWNLLSPDEQQILMRLSIFRGGFWREAAAQVAEAGLPQLSALVDRSLVQRTGTGCYGLHNVTRQYAVDQWQADPAGYAETAQRHSSYTLQWLAEKDTDLRSAGQKEALTAVAAEIANIRAAWHWAAAHQQAEALRSAAFPLFYYHEVRGLLSEGERVFSLAAELFPQESETTDRDTRLAVCALQIYQGYLSFRQGKVALADSLLRSAADLSEKLRDNTLLGRAMFYVGILEWSLGRFVAAIECMQKSLSLAVQQQDRWQMASAQIYLGMIQIDQGQLLDARQQLMAAQPLARELGDPRLLANALLIAGRVNLLLGYLRDAEQQLLECLEMTRATRDANSMTYATLYLGMVKQAQGDLTAARKFVEESLALYAEFNDFVGLERAWVTLGFLEIAADNLEAAKTHFLAFLRARQRTHSVRYVLAALVGAALVRARSGDALTALVWTLVVLQHPGVDWEAQQRASQLRAELESRLAPAEIASAQRQAAAQSFDELLGAVTAA